MAIVARLTDRPIAAEAVLRDALAAAAAAGAGALVSFCGIARPAGGSGEAVVALSLEAHPTLTAASLETIAGEAAERFGVGELLVVHRHGRIAAGETIVLVAVAAHHRRAAFEAADYLIDRLKTEAVLWKQELRLDGARWIEPSDEDRAQRARWD